MSSREEKRQGLITLLRLRGGNYCCCCYCFVFRLAWEIPAKLICRTRAVCKRLLRPLVKLTASSLIVIWALERGLAADFVLVWCCCVCVGGGLSPREVYIEVLIGLGSSREYIKYWPWSRSVAARSIIASWILRNGIESSPWVTTSPTYLGVIQMRFEWTGWMATRQVIGWLMSEVRGLISQKYYHSLFNIGDTIR